MLELCGRILPNRSKFADIAEKKCHLPKGHQERCDEFPFLRHLRKNHRSVAEKIKRDATMTTGASWKSKDAGPNRILRWVMLLSDKELKKYGINMSLLKPQVVAKLREKAADYDSCIQVAMHLTALVYQMKNAPRPPLDIQNYLERVLQGVFKMDSTCCEVCLAPLSFQMFSAAMRGRAIIETCHKDPRQHNAAKVGFAHRECNIAQGSQTLDEFYHWIAKILERAEKAGRY